MSEYLNRCPTCGSVHSKKVMDSAVQMQESNKIFYFHECLDCHIIFLFNPVKKDELDEYYNSNYLPYLGVNSFGKYKKFVSLGQMDLDRKRINVVLNNCKNLNQESFVLDFGCGNPTFIQRLQRKSKAHCVGYDLYPHGWENQLSEFNSVNLISGEIEKLNSDTKFDLITMWHTLEHEFEPNTLIDFFNKITTDDATLIVEVPNYDSLTRRLQKSFWAGYHTPRHSVVYTPNTLIKLMARHGWRARKVSRFGTLQAFTLWWLGYFDKRRKQNSSTVTNLENYFWNFLILKIMLFPIFLFEKFFSFGVMTVVFQKNQGDGFPLSRTPVR